MTSKRTALRSCAAVALITALLTAMLSLVSVSRAGAVGPLNGPGRLDPSFGGGYTQAGFFSGSGDVARGVVVDGAGNVYTCGYSTDVNTGTVTMSVAKFNSSGGALIRLNEPLSFTGAVYPGNTGASAYACVLGGGRLYVAGYVTGNSSGDGSFVAAFNTSNFSLATGFNGTGLRGSTGGTSQFRVTSMVFEPSTQDIVIAGFNQGAGTAVLARYQSNGSLRASSPTFGSAGVVTTPFPQIDIEAVALQGTSFVVAGSARSTPHSATTPVIGRYSSTGIADGTGFPADGSLGSPAGYRFIDYSTGGAPYTEIGTFNGLAISSGQKIAATGWYEHTNTTGNTQYAAVAVLNSDGTDDNTFSQSGPFPNSGYGGRVLADWGSYANPTAIQWESDGKLLASGTANGASGASALFGVARYLTNGALDTTFGEVVGAGPTRSGLATVQPGPSGQAYASFLQSDGKLVVAGTEGPDLAVARFITDATQPAQPTERVVFSDGRIVSGDINGNHLQQIGLGGSVAISSDATRVAYAGPTSISTMNIDGSGVTAVTSPPGGCTDTQPAWSPDAARIAFVRSCAAGPDVWLVDANGINPQQVTSSGAATHPTWSPDGGRIAFASGSLSSAEIVVGDVGVPLANLRQLTNNAVQDSSPSWGPTNKIVFASNGGLEIHTIDGNGATNSDVLTVGGVSSAVPAWSSDGGSIVWAGGGHNFSTAVIGGGVWIEALNPPEPGPGAPVHPVRIVAGTAASVASARVLGVRMVSSPTLSANPANVPTSAVPLQPSAPDVLNSSFSVPQLPPLHAPIPQLPVLHSPIVQLPPLHAPIVQLPVLNATFSLPQLPPLHAPIVQVPVLHAGLGIFALGQTNDLGGSDLVKKGMNELLLSEIPITKNHDWPTRLAGTTLANKPLQEITLYDVIHIACVEDTTSNPCPDGKIKPSELPSLDEIDLTAGPFGKIATLAFVLGDTRLYQIGAAADGSDAFGWCSKLETLGYGTAGSCAPSLGIPGSSLKARSASLLSLQIGKVNLDNIPGISALKMKDIDFRRQENGGLTTAAYAPLPNILLSSFDLNRASVGSIKIADLPNRDAVVDCNVTDCNATGATLASVGTAAIQPTAVIADLGHTTDEMYLQEVALGAFSGNPANDPFNLPHDDLGILGTQPGGSQAVFYAGFAPLDNITNATASIELPKGFRYVAGSTHYFSGGAAAGTTPDPTAIIGTNGNQTLTWHYPATVSPAGYGIQFAAIPGLRTGVATATMAVDGKDGALDYHVSSATPPVSVTPNLEFGDTLASATTIAPDTIYFGYLDHPSDLDYYRLPAPAAGSQINVFLNNCNCDADIVIYHPDQARSSIPMRPVPDNTPVAQGLTDQARTLSNQGEPLVPESLNDLSIAPLPIAAVSTNRNTKSESASTVAWDSGGAGFYTIQVSGYNNATSPDAYDLHVTVTPPDTALPAGNARTFSPTGAFPATPSVTRDYNTVILTAPSRMRGAYGDTRTNTALAKVDQLAADAYVNGLVLPVDSFADVRLAFAALDARPSDPERSNDVVRDINAHIDTLFTGRRDKIRSIIVVGSDDIIPMSRVPDLTQSANERTFAQQLLKLAATTGGNDALLGASAAGDILSDDPYGAFNPKPFLGTFVYTPDLALGRLVETPEDMASVIDQFMSPASGDAPGEIRPSTKLVTGYDFMTKMAQAISASLNAQISGPDAQELIGEGWTLDQLRTKFTSANPVPDVVSANAHYTPFAALPAVGNAIGDVTQLFTTSDFDSATLAKRILFEMGCHSGLSVSDFLANGGGLNTNDWPQAALRKGVAAMVANTGYGLGVKDAIAFSSQLMQNYADNLTHMTLGEALMQAKQDYIAGGPVNVYDYKAMAEATYFGIPDFRVNHITPKPTPAAPPSLHGTGYPGIQGASFTLPAGNFSSTSTSDGTIVQYGSAQKVEIAQSRPIQPRVDIDITQPGATAMGSMITALSSQDQNNFNPVLARPVTDDSTHERETQSTDVIYPAALTDTATYEAPDHTRQNLVIVPAQFQSAASTLDNSPTTGTERTFTTLNSEVYYAAAGTPAAAPPVFDSTIATKDPTAGTVSFDVLVGDPNPANSIRRVLVLWHPTGATGAWTATDLAAAPGGRWTGGASTTATDIEYFVQALSASGAVGRTTNKGDMYPSVVAPPSSVSFTINGSAVNGWYGSGTTFTLHGSPTFAVTIDGVSVGTVFDGAAVPVSGDGQHAVSYTAGSDSGTFYVPIDMAGPVINASVAPTANSAGWQNHSPVTVTFACVDPESGMATCTPASHDFTADGANQTFTATATDNRGNPSSLTVAVSLDATAPTITASPTSTSGWQNSPVTVTFTCGDSGSGLAVACPGPQSVGEGQVATASVLDVAGNVASASAGPFQIDQQAPTAQPHQSPSGYYNDQFTVSFDCADTGGSGVAHCPADQTVSPASPTTTADTVTDVAGNSTPVPSYTYQFDTIAPTITFSPDPSPRYDHDVVVTFTCADTGGSGLAAGACPPSQTVTEALPATTAASVTDRAGNTFTLPPVLYKVDTTDPVITAAVTPTPNSDGWNNTDATVTFSCSDGASGSGIANCTSPITLTGEGADQVVIGTATDNVGHTAAKFVTVNIDKTKPTITASPSNSPWYNHDVVVTFTCADALSGIVAGSCPASQTLTDTGSTAPVSVTDRAGNTFTLPPIAYKIDGGPPSITATVDPTPNSDGWNNTDATVTFTCTDTDSAIASCTAPVTLTGEGVGQVVMGSATDLAGNTATRFATVNIDKTKPTITASPSTTPWYNHDVVVNFTCADGLSGIVAGSCPASQTLTGTGSTAPVSVTDRAGNTFTLPPIAYKIDKTPPVITASVSPSANAAGWHNSDVTVTFTCTDAGGSLLASCTSPVTLTHDGANQVVTGTAVDGAGNTATRSVTINLDKTGPGSAVQTTLDLGYFKIVINGQVIGTAWDELSGVKSVKANYQQVLGPTTSVNAATTCAPGGTYCNWSAPAPPLGLYVAYSIATDVAGNVQYFPAGPTFLFPQAAYGGTRLIVVQ